MTAEAPSCPYCGSVAVLIRGGDLYPHRHDLKWDRFWRCDPCDAHVGCHKGGSQPLGRLANPELRRAKAEAHQAFDPLWKAKMARDEVTQKKARNAAYKWLAEQMGLPRKETHIGMFDVDQCRRVVELCRPYGAHVRALMVEQAYRDGVV